MVIVTKLNGKKEEFDVKKLERSLFRSGASDSAIKEVVAHVKKNLRSGMTTKELFSIAFAKLKRVEMAPASRYDLKNALMRLGKSGFPFEEFIYRIMTFEEFTCQKNRLIRGKDIPHEIDVIAKKGSQNLMIECKHFSKPWMGASIQTALYVYARFLDTKATGKFTAPMVATNTKFSPQVLRYAKGVGLELMGWRCPAKNSLEKLIEKHKAYPITMNRSLTSKMLHECLRNRVVLLSELCKCSPQQVAKMFRIPLKKAEKIISDNEKVCTWHR